MPALPRALGLLRPPSAGPLGFLEEAPPFVREGLLSFRTDGDGMCASETVLLATAQVPGNVVPDRAQMATTLGFHIILACFGIALPSFVLLGEFPGVRSGDQLGTG